MVWQTAGYLAGHGIRKAAGSAADRAKIRGAMSPAGAAVPQPLLDIDRVISDGYFFQLGVPWGWRDCYPEEMARSQAFTGLPVVAGVAAVRADIDSAGLLVSPFPLEGESIATLILQGDEFHKLRYTKNLNGRPLGRPGKIVIGGEIGLIMHVGYDEPGSHRGQPSVPIVSVSATELYFSRLGQGFRAEFFADAVHHERYLPCLWTMLGSWRWLR